MCGSFLTFDLSIKIEILHALLAVSMPSILLVLNVHVCGAVMHYVSGAHFVPMRTFVLCGKHVINYKY